MLLREAPEQLEEPGISFTQGPQLPLSFINS